MRIINFSIKRPVFTLVTMTLFLLLGAISLINIPLKLIPDIDPPIAAVVTSYDEAGPKEVVDNISRPMEESLSTLPGLNSISSISREGSSMTILEFSWATSIDDIKNDIITSMNQAPLPSGAGNPQFLKFDPSQFPIIQLSISAMSDNVNLDALTQDLESELLKINGLASVDLQGVSTEEIQVELDQPSLEEFGLDQDDVVQSLQTHNVTAPGGTVRNEDSVISTRVLFQMHNVEDIESVVLTVDTETGDDVTVNDVADVGIMSNEPDTITQTNQATAILMSIQQQSNANTAQVSSDVSERLEELLAESNYKDLETAVLFDQGDYIEEAISSVSMALIAGGLIAMTVLFVFLRSITTPLIIGIAIPFSVIVTFVLLYFTSFSLNIMTLGGLALGIGMLVDNSIVVIENIYRHLSMKKEPKKAALDGASEAATAITASTFTTISVFLPVVFITGIVGNLFREFALTVSFSLLASLLVALTVVPMIASRVLKAPEKDLEKKRQQSRFVKTFDKSTRWSLKNRTVILVITLILLIGGGFGVISVGTAFLPATDEGFFQIDVEMKPGTPREDTFEAIEEIEVVLENETEVDHYTSVTGASGNGMMMGEGNSNKASVYVTMAPIDQRTVSTMDFSDSIRRDLEQAVPNGEISVQMDASFGNSPNTFTFNLRDSSPNRLEEVAAEVQAEFADMSELTEVTNDLNETIEELQITVNEEAAREEGFVPAQIASIVNNQMTGVTATQIVTAEDEIYEVHVHFAQEYTEDVEAIENLLLRNRERDYIRLDDISTIEIGVGPETIHRVDLENAVQFTLQYGSENNLGEIRTLVEETFEDLSIPDETTVSYTGDTELLDDAISDLTLALILAVVFVYLVLAAQFESLKYPFVIMFTVPLIVIGVAIGLTVTETPVSVMAFIGLIVLVGIVVNNAIVLVDYINQRKASGMKSYEAIVDGVKDRARPILMTATTTILGLVPLAIGLGEGTELQQPLAITVISGLISATFLTLILIPVIYSFFDKDTRNLNRKYMMPNGQLIPAYLIENNYTKEEGESRTHYLIDEHGNKGIASQEENFSDFYKETDDRRVSESTQETEKLLDEAELKTVNNSFYEGNEQSVKFRSRKEKHHTSEMSREDLLDMLEDIIARNPKKKHDK
ncbi:MFS transporter [Salipaludibacillus neizhouensis]|uniref:MFS transporter n=1 Tax=Salipaludibacillus neizhouensis TaxID=885475 RepID=A0A3A9KDR5_9BACI|nr:efflux RND transporter permease subunit [Salipaludibacillus neizhouensis]RKL67783.1 MFS transporter [Salipaludibacillus neizhouensis]